MRGPGTPLPGTPGLSPNTVTSPLFNCLFPTMHESNVVLPQPDAPSKPYLEAYFKYRCPLYF